ncbi:MAG: hypothetical protein QNJ98_09780 [Planctomycetota bacterium]|nr:hypothetical protein [Planctomycetota bacterium]
MDARETGSDAATETALGARQGQRQTREAFRYLRIVAYVAGGWLISKWSTPGLFGVACAWWGIGSMLVGFVFEYLWAGPFNLITGRHRSLESAD